MDTPTMKAARKQIFYIMLTLWIYISIGCGRSYVALLFYQLNLPDSNFHLNDDEITWIGTSGSLLSPVGSVVGGFFMDAIGRKKCVQFIFIPFFVSWIAVSLASNYVVLLVGMLFSGIGWGMGMCLITYVSEIASSEHRDKITAGVELAFNFGGILCDVLMFFIKWNIVSVVFAVGTFVTFLLAIYLPESPLWLHSRGRQTEAVEILCTLRGKEAGQLEDEINDLKKSHSNKTDEIGLLRIVKNCSNGWKQLLIASMYFLCFILSGPMLLLSYNVIVLDASKIPVNSALVTVIYSAVCFVGSSMTPYFLHKCRRKTLLTVCAIGMTLCMIATALYQEFFFFSNEKPYSWIFPMAMCTFGLLNSVSVTPVAFIIGGEIFPIEARGTLQGLYGFFMTVSWSVCAKLYPFVLFNFGVRTLLWCFTGFSALLTLYCALILPETKGKTLVEIQNTILKKKKNGDCKA